MTESEREKIVEFLASKEPPYRSSSPYKDSLFLSNRFDSFTFLQLLHFLEKQFGIKFKFPRMTDFDTLDLIVGQIEKAKEKK